MACFRRTLPSLARCERPRNALSRAWRDQPGRLAQGPDEKLGIAGRLAGFKALVMASTLPDRRPSLGRGVPPTLLPAPAGKVNKPEDHGLERRPARRLRW